MNISDNRDVLPIRDTLAVHEALALAEELVLRANKAQEQLLFLRHEHAKLKADYQQLQRDYTVLSDLKRSESAERAWQRVRLLEDQICDIRCAHSRAVNDLENIMRGMPKCSVCDRGTMNGEPGVLCKDGCAPVWRGYEREDENG